jgi:hypothetical protein
MEHIFVLPLAKKCDIINLNFADMAELADAPDLGSGVFDVQVQVLLSAGLKCLICGHFLFLSSVDFLKFGGERKSNSTDCGDKWYRIGISGTGDKKYINI